MTSSPLMTQKRRMQSKKVILSQLWIQVSKETRKIKLATTWRTPESSEGKSTRKITPRKSVQKAEKEPQLKENAVPSVRIPRFTESEIQEIKRSKPSKQDDQSDSELMIRSIRPGEKRRKLTKGSPSPQTPVRPASAITRGVPKPYRASSPKPSTKVRTAGAANLSQLDVLQQNIRRDTTLIIKLQAEDQEEPIPRHSYHQGDKVYKKVQKSYHFLDRDYHNIGCGHGVERTTKFISPDKTKGFEDYGRKQATEKRRLFPLPSSKTPIKTSKIDRRLYIEAFRKQAKHGVLTAKYMNEICPFSPAINKVPKYLEKRKQEQLAGRKDELSGFLENQQTKTADGRDSEGFQNLRVVFDQDISEIKINLEDEEEKERFENLRQLLLESQRQKTDTVAGDQQALEQQKAVTEHVEPQPRRFSRGPSRPDSSLPKGSRPKSQISSTASRSKPTPKPPKQAPTSSTAKRYR